MQVNLPAKDETNSRWSLWNYPALLHFSFKTALQPSSQKPTNDKTVAYQKEKKNLSSISLSACASVKTMQETSNQQAGFASHCHYNKRAECITPAVCPGTQHEWRLSVRTPGMSVCPAWVCEHWHICAVVSQVRLWFRLWYDNPKGQCVTCFILLTAHLKEGSIMHRLKKKNHMKQHHVNELTATPKPIISAFSHKYTFSKLVHKCLCGYVYLN